ncbi:4025_t:CDS:2, partial [Dentiscutata erythropus]
MIPSTSEDPFHKIILKYSSEKSEFLKESTSQYGYNGSVYLDHSGATIYAKSVISFFTNNLTNNLFGNPHSYNPSLRRFAEENNSPIIQAITEKDLESSFKNIHEYLINDNLHSEINQDI